MIVALSAIQTNKVLLFGILRERESSSHTTT